MKEMSKAINLLINFYSGGVDPGRAKGDRPLNDSIAGARVSFRSKFVVQTAFTDTKKAS